MSLRRLTLVLVLGLGLASHARAGDPQVEARDALTKYFAAVKAGDWASMYDLISEESRGGQSREEFKTAREGGIGAALGKAIQARTRYEIGALRLAEDGARATAEIAIQMPDLRSASSGSMPTPQQVAAAPLYDLKHSMELAVEAGTWKVVRPRAKMSPEALERFQKANRESAERARQAQPPAPETRD